MKYSHYRNMIEKATSNRTLKKILGLIENDFSGINGRQYEDLRFLVLSKMYA